MKGGWLSGWRGSHAKGEGTRQEGEVGSKTSLPQGPIEAWRSESQPHKNTAPAERAGF